MPSGGHARSGPPPDPNALRRQRDATEWLHLPTNPPPDVPEWPLSRPSTREVALWSREWSRPQATAWLALGLTLEVALYVRNIVAAEARDATPPTRTLLLRQMDSLGLTIGGLARNRWVIDDAGTEPQADRQAPEVRDSAKERALKLVG